MYYIEDNKTVLWNNKDKNFYYILKVHESYIKLNNLMIKDIKNKDVKIIISNILKIANPNEILYVDDEQNFLNVVNIFKINFLNKSGNINKIYGAVYKDDPVVKEIKYPEYFEEDGFVQLTYIRDIKPYDFYNI